LQKQSKNNLKNSGFSLVELIIVIAIMAILVAVLAPMLIRYVERSRISRDVNAVGEMVQALKTLAGDPLIEFEGNTITFLWTGNAPVAPATTNVAITSADTSGAVQAAFDEIIPAHRSVSRTFADVAGAGIGAGISFSITISTGVVTMVNPVRSATYTNPNATYMQTLLEDIR